MDWINDLKSSQTARNKDVALFNKWEAGGIDTSMTIRWFKRNNRIPDRVPIKEDDFRRWLRSLGYIREENNG